ncbi:MAG: RsmD family RNA methyltransferase, partial [Chloroflexota bacterium]
MLPLRCAHGQHDRPASCSQSVRICVHRCASVVSTLLMRVIAGEARGVPLVAPAGRGTRPTSDRTKEAIFSVLGDLGCEGRVLDLFAGSGALGIEALSRGATFCDFVDSAAAACRAIEANLAKTKLAAQGRVHRQPVARFVAAATGRAAGVSYDLILMDPPYELLELDALL